MKIAIIGGTNIETLPIRYREQAVSTPYGDVVVFKGKLKEGNEVAPSTTAQTSTLCIRSA